MLSVSPCEINTFSDLFSLLQKRVFSQSADGVCKCSPCWEFFCIIRHLLKSSSVLLGCVSPCETVSWVCYEILVKCLQSGPVPQWEMAFSVAHPLSSYDCSFEGFFFFFKWAQQHVCKWPACWWFNVNQVRHSWLLNEGEILKALDWHLKVLDLHCN